MSQEISQRSADWHVYLIRTRSNALYCGITTDVERRFSQHTSGKGAKALKGKGPLQLVWHNLAGTSRSEASKVEHQIKKLPKSTKERLVRGELELFALVSL